MICITRPYHKGPCSTPKIVFHIVTIHAQHTQLIHNTHSLIHITHTHHIHAHNTSTQHTHTQRIHTTHSQHTQHSQHTTVRDPKLFL